MNYFPPSPIPDWPKRSRLDGIPLAELVATHRLQDPHRMAKASAKVRSHLFRNGEPMICLSCGRATAEDGETVCGH